MSVRQSFIAVFFFTMFTYLMVKASWISDPDIFWHLAVGRDILTTWTLPSVDNYSYSANGQPWIAKEWLAQIIFYSVYQVSGFSGLVLLCATVTASAMTMLFIRLVDCVKWTIAVGLVWLAVPFLSLSLIARPQIFFFLIFALYICEIERAAAANRRPSFWLLPLTVLWANLHASFPVALVLIGFGFFEIVMRNPRENLKKAIADYAPIGIGVALCFGVTPYGFHSLYVAYNIVGYDLSRYILEWRPINWSHYRTDLTETLILGGWLGFQTIGALTILGFARGYRPRILPVLAFSYMTLRHIRFCSMFAIGTAAYLGRAIGDRFPRFGPRPFPDDATHRKISGVAAAIAFLMATSIFVIVQHDPEEGITPIAALSAAEHAGLEGRVYNSYGFGGYLIWRGVPTLIDGRTELFLHGVIETILDPIIENDRGAFAKSLAQFGVDWSIVKTGSAEAKLFAAESDWSLIHHDETAEIYGRRK